MTLPKYVLGIDPGPTESAIVEIDTATLTVHHRMILPNAEARAWLLEHDFSATDTAIEMIASYGMPVGADVFETVVWIGRFNEIVAASRGYVRRVKRHEIKMTLCGHPRAKDTNIRQRLLDVYGGRTAVGTKRAPGPLYGFKSHMWAALAVALTYVANESPTRMTLEERRASL